MKCNKLFKEAFEKLVDSDPALREQLNAARKKTSGYEPKPGEGIDINSKMSTAIAKIIKTQPGGEAASFKPESLRNMLLAEGVSKDEIALLTKNLLDKPSLSARDKQLLKILSPDEAKRMGLSTNSNNRVAISEVLKSIEANKIEFREMSKQYPDITYKEQGSENPSYKVTGIYGKGIEGQTAGHFPESEREGLLGWNRVHTGDYKDGKALYLNEFQSDWAQNPNLQTENGEFPIDHTKFKKLAVVQALDTAINRGLDTMVIPIERTKNNLVGSENITKIYEGLGDTILPSIRKELDKQGLAITHKRVVVDGDAFHEIKIVPKAGQANNKYHPNFRDDVGSFVELDALDLPRGYNSTLRELEEGATIQIAGKEFTNDDILDYNDTVTISKRLAEALGAKIPQLRQVAKDIFYKDVQRNYEGKAIGKGMTVLKDELNSMVKAAKDLNSNTNHAHLIENMLELDEISSEARDMLMAIDTHKVINKQEFNAILDNIPGLRESLPDFVLNERAWLDTVNGGMIRSDAVLDGVAYSIDDYNYYKELIPNLPEFYKPKSDSVKVRWDMLGVIGGLGLSSEYEALEN